jgi:outer membrane protein OmpA-like peptidoglycan-associated protein
MTRSRWTTALGAAGMGLALAACATTGKVVKTQAACADQNVQIYFEPDSAEVTTEGRAVLRQAAALTKGCAVDKVDVLGLADAAGAPAANLQLSERRAQAVTAALTQAGLPKGDFAVAAAGQAGSLTAAGETRPLRRRADIVLHLSAPR